MKKIIAILLSFILCFNFSIIVDAEEITEPYEENFATEHHNYLMGLINQLLELLNNIFNLLERSCPGHSGGVATCCEKAICDNCGLYYGNYNPKKHKNIINTSEIEPTCTKVGSEGACKYCTACDTVISGDKIIPALGHIMLDREETPHVTYDPKVDKIKYYCARYEVWDCLCSRKELHNCNYAEYEDIQPLSITIARRSLAITGGYYPDCEVYITKTNGVIKQYKPYSGLASKTMFARYYSIDGLNLETITIFEVRAYDCSNRTLTKQFFVNSDNKLEEIK